MPGRQRSLFRRCQVRRSFGDVLGAEAPGVSKYTCFCRVMSRFLRYLKSVAKCYSLLGRRCDTYSPPESTLFISHVFNGGASMEPQKFAFRTRSERTCRASQRPIPWHHHGTIHMPPYIFQVASQKLLGPSKPTLVLLGWRPSLAGSRRRPLLLAYSVSVLTVPEVRYDWIPTGQNHGPTWLVPPAWCSVSIPHLYGVVP